MLLEKGEQNCNCKRQVNQHSMLVEKGDRGISGFKMQIFAERRDMEIAIDTTLFCLIVFDRK